MDTRTDDEPPPRSTDLDGWRQAVADGRYRKFKLETIVAAIQDLGPKTDKSVLNTLALHLSDTILRILRWRVGRNHRNEGKDIIEDAHGQIVQAMLNPKSADGKGLREAFVPRVQFRAADAIREDRKTEARERDNEALANVAGNRSPQETNPCQELDQQMDLESVLSHVTDERKRLAFRLHMDGIPLESKRTASIAKALGVSSKTAGQWIEEVRAQLRTIVREQP